MALGLMRSEMVSAMASARAGRAAADALCTSCTRLLDVDGAAVSLVRDGVMSGTYGSSSATSRRLDEYQFTFGEGPCLDVSQSGAPVLAAELNSSTEHRWPMFREAVLADGVHSVFAVPITIASLCVGSFFIFRERSGSLLGDALAGASVAAELAVAPLLHLIASSESLGELDTPPSGASKDESDTRDDLDRIDVHQAAGMLIVALDVSADEAMLRLRAHAMSTGQSVITVAQAIKAHHLRLDRDDTTRW